MSRIIVTRTQPGADSLAARLRGLGYEATAMPVLAARPTHAPCPVEESAIGALAITSAQAIPFLPPRLLAKRRVYAVGKATARHAALAGAQEVICAADAIKDVAALAARVRADCPPGLLLHAGAAEPAAGTRAALEGTGRATAHWAVYETKPAPFDAPAFVKALALAPFLGVTLHSPKGARLFCNAVRPHILPENSGKMTLLCVSPAVLESVDSLPCGHAYTARTPDEDALIAAVAAHARPALPFA